MAEDGEQRVILNVGGVKYETYRSTLIKYPETLLGVMFSSRNEALLHPTNKNEYFFDRNGEAFRYIMTFYRTGKTHYENNPLVTESELNAELDYFQIPSIVNYFDYDLAHKEGAKFLNKFIDLIESIVFENICVLEPYIKIGFSNCKEGTPERICTNFDILKDVTKKEFIRFESLDYIGSKILRKYKNEINTHLDFALPGKASISFGYTRCIIVVSSCIDFDKVAKLSRMMTNKTN
ncbi:3530_t:CDS:2 [Dentiscutata erythropus]|uniref:3530_t:CDS:1 n=1 Tax=Dentiscutata erythropus TaxID=1348616 RepID=A0A9N9EV21_9GLOM|nr:3530_t:CDS:2 [Dentiscutata erythropus]